MNAAKITRPKNEALPAPKGRGIGGASLRAVSAPPINNTNPPFSHDRTGVAFGRKRSKKEEKRPLLIRRRLLWIAAVFLFGAGLSGSAWGFERAYRDRVFPRVNVGDVSVAGATRAEVNALFEAYADRLENDGFTFTSGETTLTLKATMASLDDLDLVLSLIRFDPIASTEVVMTAGRNGTFLANVGDQVTALVAGATVTPAASIDAALLEDLLQETFGSLETPAENPVLVETDDGLGVTPEHSGQVFDWATVTATVAERINSLSLEPITLSLVPDEPTVTAAQAETLLAEAETVVEALPPTFTDGTETWRPDRTESLAWIVFERENGGAILTLGEGAEAYLETLGAAINQEPKIGDFRVEGGRVTAFASAEPGRTLDRSESRKRLEESVLAADGEPIELAITTTEPPAGTDTATTYGIRELIGIGTSDFKGSPTNRKFNIGVGAEKLNGTLIPPGTTFSFLRALGPVDGSTGYRPELVIKGNKTTPEFGGGLCQISTTTFRAALDAGLPIVERTNHSYRVSYYEPAGTDATVYDPAPDLKFENDTGHYILIQTTIEGTTLTFEFWGTRDGRSVAMTEPVIGNLVSPPPTNTIETTDLKPGERKCTERAHTGATAAFDRTVTLASGEVRTETIRSKYKPWQEVCLVGVAEQTTPAPAAEETDAETPESAAEETPAQEAPIEIPVVAEPDPAVAQ